ncbi:MAG: diguanylate cyclase [Deltaproteobacteria bacterium]|nr:diguanylate cyclase [Deltaproteobacteria bacterium]NCP03177.1 diguanylate cyclase [Deltaproteobacteria bacterium]
MAKLETSQLTRQFLWPLGLLLLVLAAASVIGSTLLLNNNLGRATTQQLEHAREMAYRELKERELRVADILSLLSRTDLNSSSALLTKKLHSYLPSTTLQVYDIDNSPNQLSRDLMTRAVSKGRGQRQIVFDPATQSYAVFVIEPIQQSRRALAVRLPLDEKLLEKLAKRYASGFTLFNAEGQLMVSSDMAASAHWQLTRTQLAQLQKQEHLLTSQFEDIHFRQLIAPLPLGDNDSIYLSTWQSSAPLNKLLLNNIIRLLLTIFCALILAILLYYRRLQRTLAPLKNLLDTIQLVAQGNLAARSNIPETSQLHELGDSFNQMLGELENLYRNRLAAEKSAALTQETLKYNNHLKKKNLEIEKINIQLKEQYQELSVLFQTSRSMTSTLDKNLLYEKIFTVFRESIPCERVIMLLYQAGEEMLEVIKTSGINSSAAKGLAFKLGEGISGIVAASMQAIYSPDLSVDERNLSYKGRWVSSGSLFSMPMVVQNTLIGVINLHSQKIDAFPTLVRQMAQAIADQAAISIENARLYEKTRSLSATDELTGLANRRQFNDFLQREWSQARRYHTQFALLMIDIDHFKFYNDANGHLNGDIALKKIAALLLQSTRGIDLVARFGGEEFVIMLPRADQRGALAVANKLCLAIEKEYFVGMEKSQPDNKITVSIGIACFPTDSTEIYDLLNLADEALYQAKERGRNSVLCWTKAMIKKNPQ